MTHVSVRVLLLSFGLLHLTTLVACYNYNVTVNLRNGDVFPGAELPEGFEWIEPLTSSNDTGSCTCNMRGVLKMTLDRQTRKCAEFHLMFEDSKQFSFQITDGDRNGITTEKMLETERILSSVSSYDDDLRVFRISMWMFPNNKYPPRGIAQEYHFLNGFVQLTLGNLFNADNGKKSRKIGVFKAFTEDWKKSKNGPEVYYVGFNRLAFPSPERGVSPGSGLCWMGISWRNRKAECGKRHTLGGLKPARG